MTEAEWLIATGAEDLWAFVRSETRFNRCIIDSNQGKWDDYNQRLLYLLGVAVCQRLAALFPDPCCQQMLEVAESFAEGRASPDELADAHDVISAINSSLLPVATGAAVNAVFWLSPDDYKVIRTLEFVGDAFGYLRAIDAGDLPAGATRREGEAVWKHPSFLAGREAEERAVCDLIRDVIGNPFHPVRIDPSWMTPKVVALAQAIYDQRAFDRLPSLADALEEAGCHDAEILAHLRGPGQHVRGCWVVDLLLGKE